MKIMLLNGVNLNLIEVRNLEINGDQRLEPFLDALRAQYPAVQLDYFQSNVEGEIVNKLQEVGFDYDGIIFNPGAFSHYSYALADMVAGVTAPVIEVHLLNPAAMDASRPPSLTAKGSRGVIAGLGLLGYRFALESLLHSA
jgi:3-dehydroquinate dehydratase-2